MGCCELCTEIRPSLSVQPYIRALQECSVHTFQTPLNNCWLGSLPRNSSPLPPLSPCSPAQQTYIFTRSLRDHPVRQATSRNCLRTRADQPYSFFLQFWNEAPIQHSSAISTVSLFSRRCQTISFWWDCDSRLNPNIQHIRIMNHVLYNQQRTWVKETPNDLGRTIPSYRY